MVCIGGRAFANCNQLMSLNIPAGVTSIDAFTFRGCSGLTAVTLPETITLIGEEAFSGCTSLAEIVIPNGVVSILYNAFYNCSSLARVDIPDSVKDIGVYAFAYCTNLTSIDLPCQMTCLDYGIFTGCAKLTRVLIPPGITQILDYAFADCSMLNQVTMRQTGMTIGPTAFLNCPNIVIDYYDAHTTAAGDPEPFTDLTSGITLDFTHVLTGGDTGITQINELPPSDYFQLSEVAAYYWIETSAAFDAPVTISIPYDPAVISGLESELRLYQFKDGQPVDITLQVDTELNIIYGLVTDHFCSFAVGLPFSISGQLQYNGSLLFSYPGSAVLSCQVTADELSTPQEFSQVQVSFKITPIASDDSIGSSQVMIVPCDQTGNGTCELQLLPGVYQIEAAISATSDIIVEASPVSVLIVVYDPGAGYATGAGSVNNGEPVTDNPGSAHFAFMARYKSDLAYGNFQFQYLAGDLCLNSRMIDWLTISSINAQFAGTGYIRGMTGICTFRVSCSDNEKKGIPDRITIKIWAGTDTSQDPIYQAINQSLVNGNILVNTR